MKNPFVRIRSAGWFAVNTMEKVDDLVRRMDALQQAVGRIEQIHSEHNNSSTLADHEFKVYSQWGEDGIIQHLLRRIPVPNSVFVEFGVENYREANTRFLLQNNYWSGLVIDGASTNIQAIKSDPLYWKYNLKVECAFIDRENINTIMHTNGVQGDIGLLSIDIDGNDYWIWEAITCIQPRIVVCEYNSLFGYRHAVTVPYERRFVRTQAHYSNLYFGASIAALDYLAKSKGYSLVGSTRAGNNAFFVRDDIIDTLRVLSPENAWVRAAFREARNADGILTFLDPSDGQRLLADLPLYDVEHDALIRVADLSSEKIRRFDS